MSPVARLSQLNYLSISYTNLPTYLFYTYSIYLLAHVVAVEVQDRRVGGDEWEGDDWDWGGREHVISHLGHRNTVFPLKHKLDVMRIIAVRPAGEAVEILGGWPASARVIGIALTRPPTDFSHPLGGHLLIQQSLQPTSPQQMK